YHDDRICCGDIGWIRGRAILRYISIFRGFWCQCITGTLLLCGAAAGFSTRLSCALPLCKVYFEKTHSSAIALACIPCAVAFLEYHLGNGHCASICPPLATSRMF